MKEFLFIDILESLKERKLKRNTQLFLISLIAYFSESQRRRGEFIDDNIAEDRVSYKIYISDNEIRKKFKFSIDTIINIKRELKEKIPISIEAIKIISKSKKYKAYKYATTPSLKWLWKYENYENEYVFEVARKNRREIYLPIKLIYDKHLTYSEKLAIIWNICLQMKLDRKPKLREIQKESGISERTIRKAKKKCPEYFFGK